MEKKKERAHKIMRIRRISLVDCYISERSAETDALPLEELRYTVALKISSCIYVRTCYVAVKRSQERDVSFSRQEQILYITYYMLKRERLRLLGISNS